jgi:hypothetical protein
MSSIYLTQALSFLTQAVIAIGGRLAALPPKPQPQPTNQAGLEQLLLTMIRDHDKLNLEQFVSWAIEETYQPGQYTSQYANWAWWATLALLGDVDGLLTIISDYEHDVISTIPGSADCIATMQDLESLRTVYLPLARKASQGAPVVREVLALKPTKPPVIPVVFGAYNPFNINRN